MLESLSKKNDRINFLDIINFDPFKSEIKYITLILE